MNIEIANRLVQLRKKYGYSQEELAEKLGISRQAVSKWERAESSPDTDNLICLAKLYNVSLDELLNTEDDLETILNEKKEEKKKDNIYVNIGAGGVRVKDGDEEVHVSWDGIHIKEGSDVVHFGSKIHEFENVKFTKSYEEFKKKKVIVDRINGCIALMCVIAYIVMGSVWNLWHPGWIVFLLIPIFPSILEAILYKDAHKFAFPVFIAALYLLLGCVWDLWHPCWFLFLLIPIYYQIVPKGIYKVVYRKENGEDVKDFVDKRQYKEDEIVVIDEEDDDDDDDED